MKEKIDEDILRKYKDNFSDSKFWEKLKKFAKKLGLKSTSYALILYYVLKKEEVPKSDKLMILGCLGYLIVPIDLIPDLLPLGYGDDIAGMLFAVKRCLQYIDDDVKDKVKSKLVEWFKVEEDYIDNLLIDI